MAETVPVGQFEQLVLSAVVFLDEAAYGVTIHDKVREIANKDVNMGALYVTLDRLEKKGLLKSSFSDPTPQRGGRPKRLYQLEPAGEAALKESLDASMRAFNAAIEVMQKQIREAKTRYKVQAKLEEKAKSRTKAK